jgi:hypothetical protein
LLGAFDPHLLDHSSYLLAEALDNLISFLSAFCTSDIHVALVNHQAEYLFPHLKILFSKHIGDDFIAQPGQSFILKDSLKLGSELLN